MKDYISEEVAFVIREQSYPGVINGMAADAAGETYDIAVADRFDIARAIRQALTANDDSYTDRANAARTVVRSTYGEKRIASLVRERIQELRHAAKCPNSSI
jgi:hypothetical protein